MRITHRDFRQGLWPLGGREGIPASALHQAKNVHPYNTPALRSRWGCVKKVTLPSTPIRNMTTLQGYDGEVRIVYAGSQLYAVAGSTWTSLLNPQSRGGQLRFARAVPSNETDERQYRYTEHLYVVGTALTAAGDFDGTRTLWRINEFVTPTKGIGLPPPGDEWSVARHIIGTMQIELFDLVTRFTAKDCSLALVTTNKQQGNGAMQITVAQDVKGIAAAPLFIDLSKTPSGVEFASQDWIQMWVFCTDPDHLSHIELIFGCNIQPSDPTSTANLSDSFSFKIFVDDTVSSDPPEGTSDAPEFSGQRDVTEVRELPTADVTFAPTEKVKKKGKKKLDESVAQSTTKILVEGLGATKISPVANTWTLLRIPRGSFEESGKPNWSGVSRLWISVNANKEGGVTVLLDDLNQHIGVGKYGDYKVALTYRDYRTGIRSNSGIVKTVTGVRRDALILTNVPYQAGLDAGANQLEIWVTLGGGNVLFLARQVPMDLVTDRTVYEWSADFPAMHDDVKQLTSPPPGMTARTSYLSDTELPFDNVQPPASALDIFGPWQGTMFYLDGVQRGRVYYSPPGRPESVAGYLLVSGSGDPTMRGIIWNQPYVFTKSRLFEITGGGPFVGVEILGVPGTTDPDSVISTPFGIAYRAADGPRLFDGASSRLIAPDPVNALFLGESNRDTLAIDGELPAFGTTTGVAYHREEYILTDGTLCLAVNLRTGAWRQLTVGGTTAPRALFAEPSTGKLLAGVAGALWDVEVTNTLLDDATAVRFVAEVPGTILEDQYGRTKIVQRIALDIDTKGQTLLVYPRYSGPGAFTSLYSVSTASRAIVEQSLCFPGDVMSVQIAGSLTQPIDLYGVTYDVHFTEEGGGQT